MMSDYLKVLQGHNISQVNKKWLVAA